MVDFESPVGSQATQASLEEITQWGFHSGRGDQSHTSGGSARRWKKDAQKRILNKDGNSARASSSSSALPRDFLKAEEAANTCPPLPLRFISWNCRGLGKGDTVSALRRLCRTKQPHYLFLMETKGGREKFDRLGLKMGFQNSVFVEARGAASGLALLWTNDLNLRVVWTSDRIVCCKINDPIVRQWCLMGCHGSLNLAEKDLFWENLEMIARDCNLPWAIMVDLNEVVEVSEKMGGRDIWRRKLYLKSCI